MVSKPNPPIIISSLSGGMNDTETPSSLPDDQCVLAENIEFFWSNLGERRNGCGPLSITSASLSDEATICHISQWFPTNNVRLPEYWAVGATNGVSTSVARRDTALSWHTVALSDAMTNTFPNVFDISTQSLNGKLFFSYPSAQDRLHVWDGTSVRRTGLAQPSPPTGANEGVGVYGTTRYFRIRVIEKSGSTIIRRSEPSTTLTFTPSGTGAGTRVTRPTLPGEGETHWELEASTDNVLFYLIATTIVATTTVDDEIAFATGYTAGGVLSEDIGNYLNLYSAKFMAVDGDRLILASHWTDLSKQSQVGWTPVHDDPGKGNDERLPLLVDNTIQLDNYDGGPLTGIIASSFGVWYAFKWNHIYQMTRTGDVAKAYQPITLSTTRGAIPGSIVRGVDENGSSSIYFLDPSAGPSRVGPYGIQKIEGLRTTWSRVNAQATNITARGCYYPLKHQIIWWVAVDGNDTPNLVLKLQVSEVKREIGDNVGRGWSIATGRIAEANAVGVLTEVVAINNTTSLSERPFIGLTSPDFIQRCDTESTDAGVAYRAILRTKAYLAAGLLNKWGTMTAAILATANATASIVVKLIRNMNLETTSVTTDFNPLSSEELVVKNLDNLAISDATLIQIEFSDP